MKTSLSLLLFLLAIGCTIWLKRLALLEALISSKLKIAEVTANEMRVEKISKFNLFDIRSFDEYQLSHLPNAIFIDDKTKPKDFIEKYQRQLLQKASIFYCSVGYRSSLFAIAVEQSDLPFKPLYNLRGGIFRWHKKGLGITGTKVHPYSSVWGLFR